MSARRLLWTCWPPHPHFRGAQFVALAERVAVAGWLDPVVLGWARVSGRYDPEALKRVWHYLARFGREW